eukprot:UC4_evm1s816
MKTLGYGLGRGIINTLVNTSKKTSKPRKDSERTAGVDVKHVSISGAGEYTVFDFAGHSEYYLSHELFLENKGSVFVILCSLKDEPVKQRQDILYWLRFICAKVGVPNDPKEKLRVILAG